jgi:hypothetical protein
MNGVSGKTGDEEKNMLRQFTEAARKACEWATLWGRDELSAEVSQPVRVEFELLEPRLLLDGQPSQGQCIYSIPDGPQHRVQHADFVGC